MKYGWRPDKPDIRDFRFSLEIPVVLPGKVDLRAQCPTIYNQGELGSCTSNAIGAAFEFERLKQKESDFMPSRLFIYYNERAMEGTVNSDAGAEIRDGIKSIAKIGVCPEKDWVYDISKFKRKPPKKCYDEAKNYTAIKYERLHNVTEYKTALAKGYPFIFGFSVYESFESQEVAKTGIVPMPLSGEQLLGGHCSKGVGYDDSKEWYICRNSWGDSWGDGGYFYLPYKYFNNKLTSDFWVLYLVK